VKLKIGFAYDKKDDYPLSPDDPPDKYAEFDNEETISSIENALGKSNHTIIRIGNAKSLLKKLLDGERWDMVFNICEGVTGRSRESHVPAILELFDIPYTGSDPLTMSLTLDKIMAKKVMRYHGIKTADFVSVESADDLSPKKFKLRFPLIVKPSQEGTSKGISKESVVRNFSQMKKRAQWIVSNYRQPALIEEFIVGYEFTVAIVGNGPPEVLPPVQIAIKNETDLGDDFYTHARVESKDIKYICPADIDAELSRKIIDLSLAAYRALGCRDLGRIDVRVDYNNEPYFLECNPLPNLGLIDVFPLVAKASKRTYEELICYILESALKRYSTTA
ncbi:MAG: D-alanine--D-alanine ligase, partial [Elusimicrobia bacterium]|nr:D-alanine--D-alanine ligase [Elusimicrobiota bacterium]